MFNPYLQTLLIAVFAASARAVTFQVPRCAPKDARRLTSANPVTVSLEFFTFPGYVNDVPSTEQCLANLRDLTGEWPPIRIGGTTQDRATYAPASLDAVTYSVDDPDDAPTTLTFGPSFFDLADDYEGQVTIGNHVGLNRRLNHLNNTIQAAEDAVSAIDNLKAIELGNEPNFYTDDDPIAKGNWTAARDYATEIAWQKAVAASLPANNLISAGVFFDPEPFSLTELAPLEEAQGALRYVKEFSSHNYPQSSPDYDLQRLMSHSQIAEQIAPFAPEIEAAHAVGKPHVIGETNSATQGGGGISPTFGAALWLMDYSIQMLLLGTETLYFHQGTIGNCQYCWWGRYNMGAPYYGAYMAQLALAGSDAVMALDDASSPYAGYAFYANNEATKVLLYNSEYYTNGTRSFESFTLEGLDEGCVTAKRLTAASATARQDRGQIPTIGGQYFEDGTCEMVGELEEETTEVVDGSVTFDIKASEALLVYLN